MAFVFVQDEISKAVNWLELDWHWYWDITLGLTQVQSANNPYRCPREVSGSSSMSIVGGDLLDGIAVGFSRSGANGSLSLS